MREDAPPAGLTLREIVPADEPFLRELYRSVRDPELALTPWSEEQKRAFSDQQFDFQDRWYRSQYAGARFLVIERQGAPIGRLYLHETANETGVIGPGPVRVRAVVAPGREFSRSPYGGHSRRRGGRNMMLKRAYAALVAALAAAGIFLGNAAHAQTPPDVRVLRPTIGEFMEDVSPVWAQVFSTAPITSVTAAIDGRSVPLVYPTWVCADGRFLPCSNVWSGDLDITGLLGRRHNLVVTATDAAGNVGSKAIEVVHRFSTPVTDLDGDGRSDLLYRDASTGLIYRLLMDGFSIKDTGFVYYEPDLNWHVVADADFNGDGIHDLLWRNAGNGQVYMQLFGEQGVPVPWGGRVFWIEPKLYWEIIAVLDFDGDGMADILWQNTITRDLYAMRMNGSYITAQAPIAAPPSPFFRWVSQVAGDFTGSGKRNQLLWRDGFDGQVYLMTIAFANGAFSVSYSADPIYQESNQNWAIIAAADFDGDGKSDILWRNGSTGEVWMMLMDGRTIARQGSIYQEPNLDWAIASVGDYDGDRKSDILWRNTRTGQVWMMLMNGMAIASQGMVYTMPDTNWYLLGSSNYPRGSGYIWTDPIPTPHN